MKSKEKIRIAIVGCGAVTEIGYLPAASISSRISLPAAMGLGLHAKNLKCNDAEITALADINLTRAEALARRFGVPYACNDFKHFLADMDAAIVALPHYLHAPVSIELLKQGIHVLVEKPMALNTSECDAMIQAAKQSGATLAVGIVRRFLPPYQFLKTLIDSGLLGKISSFDVREGLVYGWPVASDFFFRKETAGGGVLIDTGAYTMDMVQWWFGDCRSLEYLDDSMGGVEADCEIHLEMESGVLGYIELSRTRNLRNTIVVQGEKGSIEMSLHSPAISISPKDSCQKLTGHVLEKDAVKPAGNSFAELLKAELEDWVEAIINKRQPRVPGEEGRKSIALIEACYKNRKLLSLPWMSPISVEDIKQ